MVTNSLGLQLAGIHEESADPPGGEFARDIEGRLNGLLLERPAFSHVTKLLPNPTEEEQKASLHPGIDAFSRRAVRTISASLSVDR